MELGNRLRNLLPFRPRQESVQLKPLKSTIRLTEAVVLGDMMFPRKSTVWFEDGEGCALGRAFLAAGHTPQGIIMSEQDILRAWPWLNPYLNVISIRFAKVCHGKITFEDLVESIRTLEDHYAPAAPSVDAEEKKEQPCVA